MGILVDCRLKKIEQSTHRFVAFNSDVTRNWNIAFDTSCTLNPIFAHGDIDFGDKVQSAVAGLLEVELTVRRNFRVSRLSIAVQE